MRRNISAATSFLFLTLAAAPAGAEGLLEQKSLPAALAVEAAVAANAACAKVNSHVAVDIVDRTGADKLLLVGDGASALTVTLGHRKAYTTVMLGDSTAAIAKRAQAMPDGGKGMRELDPNFILLPGALPIRAGTELIGAIAVSGAAGPDGDETCAQAGLDKIKDRLG